MFNKGGKLKLSLISIFLVASFFAGSFALAQISIPASVGGTFGLGTQNLYSTVIKAINVFLGFLGVIAISVIAYGGFIWMTSGGSPERINKAKQILISAVIGLVIILLSFAIVQFISSSLTGGGGGISPGAPCNCATELGLCDPGGLCLSCQNTVTPGVCTWQADNTCPGCGTLPSLFVTQGFSPPNGAINIIRNVVPKVYFSNGDPDSLTVNNTTFIIRNTDLGIDVLGTRVTVGNRVEFTPSAACPPPFGALNCLDANTNFEIEVTNGILRLSDGTALTCGGFGPSCIAVFQTGDIIDVANPTIDLIANSQICLGTANNLTFSAMDDGGISQVEFFDSEDNSAFITPLVIPCPGPGVCGQDPIPWNPAPGVAIWNPIGPTYVAGTSYTVTARASDLDAHTVTGSRTFTLREAHCCNLTQDFDEDGIDCGGADCAGCNGAACGVDLATDCGGPGDCSINNNKCASNICNCAADIPTPDPTDDPALTICEVGGYDTSVVSDCCLCEGPPLIDCVTPSLEDNCDEPHTPIGTTGTLLSIWGRNFGTYVPGVSTVTINGVNADLAETINSSCTGSWTNTQIVVVVPPGAGSGPITVNSASGYSDATNDLQGKAINDFTDDGLARPSLCMVENIEPGSSCFGNNCGHFQETVRGSGIGISPGDIVEFGNAGSNFAGLFSTPIPNLLVEAQVSNISPGTVGLRALSLAGQYSNYLNFNVTTAPGGPHIDYLDPTFGPEGQYVTIYGSNLGNSSAGNSVTFGGIPGDFTFPNSCGPGDYWRSSYIIVKVPAGIIIGSNDVVVTVNGTPSNAVPFNVCALNPATCPLLPGMCKIQPTMGPWNTLVDIWGEYFGAAQGSVEFYDGVPALPNTASQSIATWTDVGAPTGSEILDAEVPDILDPGGAAESGPVYIINSVLNYSSNSIPFEVGTCTTNADCSNPMTEVCCGGTCYTGSCPAPNYSTYTWSFTTGDYFVEEDCDPGNLPASPTPWSKRSGGQDVCINAAISAKFTEPVIQATVTSATVLIDECAGPINNPCSILNPVAGALSYIDYDANPADVDGFIFSPGAVLNQNAWYQITLLGGSGNITAVNNTIPLVDDYIWTFKTRNSGDWCQVGKVAVAPNSAKLIDAYSGQNFVAVPITANNPCVSLNPSLYNWTWNSTDLSVATVTGSVVANETASPVLSGNTKIQATILPDNITGEATLTVDFEGLVVASHWYECQEVCVNSSLGTRFDREVDITSLTTGAGQNINIYSCGVDQTCSNYLAGLVALNPITYIWDVVTGNSEAAFDSIADYNLDEYYRVVLKGGPNGIRGSLGSPLMSLNENLAYGEECEPAITGSCDFGTCLWSGDGCGTSHAECTNTAPGTNADGCTDTCYNGGSVTTTCVVGLPDGSDAIRENCDYKGMCRDVAGNVLGDGTIIMPHSFCRIDADCPNVGDTCDVIANDGCNNLCLLTGSTHTAVCGDSKIEWGEACDDGNQTSGDGCNNRCLREGRTTENNPANPFSAGPEFCGDGITDRTIDGAGEDCDDGNNINGDGCSADCLSEGAPGSSCGDGSVGIGEDCDGQKGCDPVSCLWQGSGGEAQCGNDIIEGPDNDRFSWVFKTKSATDDSCTSLNVEIAPGTATMIMNEVKNFKAVVRTAADECDPRGQTLNPWDYDWSWWSDDILVADILTTCGDGQVDTGEDCDEGGICNDLTPCTVGGPLCSDSSVCLPDPAGINNCTFNCLNDGGSLSCGDGVLWDGEDCDDGPGVPVSGDGCSANCLNEGAVACALPTDPNCCGNGLIEIGEDCDDNNLNNFDGCSSVCLNEGTSTNYPTQNVIGIGVGNTLIHAQESGGFEGTAAVTINKAFGAVPCQIEGCPDCDIGVTDCGIFECKQAIPPSPTADLCGAPNAALGNVDGCYCCCDPTNDKCGDLNPNLECIPDQAPCTGGTRGQCCGCEDDSDCAAMPQPFCGSNTCCHDAPTVNAPTIPILADIGVCRNILVSATFDQEMDVSTFSGNFEFAKRYDALITPTCPSGESPSAFIAPGGGYIYCVVSGYVNSRTEDLAGLLVTTLEFSPSDVLDPLKRYYATIYGAVSALNAMTCGNRKIDPGEDCDDGNNIINDGCGIDCLHEGTIAPLCGNGEIDPGEDCDSTPNCGANCTNLGTAFPVCSDGNVDPGEDCDDNNILGGDGCSANCLNEGTFLTGVKSIYDIPMQATYQWFFETGEDICRITDIKITSIVGNGDYGRINYDNASSDLFICSGLDDGANPNNVCYRDALRPSATPPIPPDNPNMAGNQHVYQVRPIDQSGNQLNFSLFDWFWDENDADDIFILHDTTDVATIDLTSVNLAATSNPTNGQGYINISATSTNPLLGQMTKRFNIQVFLCNNPWPDIDWWPWEDDIAINSAADCDNPMGGCTDTFFELFYCRDYGDPGPEDDLPRISTNPMVFGQSIDPSNDIFKEFLFIQDESGSGGPLVLNAFADPCKGFGGQIFDIEARVIDMDGVPAGGVVAHIQSTVNPLLDIDTIVLTDAAVGVVGDHLYGASWDSTGFCPPVSECSYFIDIYADDTLTNQTILDNISCI